MKLAQAQGVTMEDWKDSISLIFVQQSNTVKSEAIHISKILDQEQWWEKEQHYQF